MRERKGAPSGTGSRASHEAASSTASSPEASIPSALDQLDYLVSALERVVMHAALAPAKGRPPRILFESAVGSAKHELEAWRTIYADTAQKLDAYRDYWADGGEWECNQASAIEARSDATTKIGAAEGESAVGSAETPNLNHHHGPTPNEH